MKLDFFVEPAVKARYSVRTYDGTPLSPDMKDKLRAYMQTSSNPFSAEVKFRLLESNIAANGEKLGTYGVIKGASDFIGATVVNEGLSLEALGYEFEKLILYAASLGLGTCWLGGTFNRSAFAEAMSVQKNELFPAISPLGYPAAKKRFTESLMRKSVGADHRKPWSKLFYKKDFSAPLTEADAGAFAFPLEMLRLAPSASNKQPWRVVLDGNNCHFYEEKSEAYTRSMAFDIQRVDIGIAACHFHLAAMERDMSGSFQILPEPISNVPKQLHYIFSWVSE